MSLNWNHLALFYAAARSGKISAGAEQMHVSQPAVTKQIQELERALGVTLFDRLPRGVRLTSIASRRDAAADRVPAPGVNIVIGDVGHIAMARSSAAAYAAARAAL